MVSVAPSIYIALITFVVTISFSNAYIYFRRYKISSLITCLAGGLIIATLMFDIFPELFKESSSRLQTFQNNIGILICGITFIVLFSIDKFILDSQDTMPEAASLNKALIFISAISVHSLLEGLGCDLMVASGRKSAYMFCMMGHKWVEAFVVGVSIGNGRFKRSTAFLLSLFYSILTPVGILIGMYAVRIVKNVIVDVFLIGLSCGSFIYIGFLEMLVCEFKEKTKNDRNKMAAVMAGFLIMSCLMIIMKCSEK